MTIQSMNNILQHLNFKDRKNVHDYKVIGFIVIQTKFMVWLLFKQNASECVVNLQNKQISLYLLIINISLRKSSVFV